MKANWNAAKAKAQEIRKKYSPDTDSPVSAFEIAGQEGINIAYFMPEKDSAIENASGMFLADHNTIYLNANEPADRQNFTLAHELAHYFLKHKPSEHGISWRYNAYADGTKPAKEQEADCFAAELLMPKELIDRFKKKYDLGDTNVATLAKLFGVSPSAMKYRLSDIKKNG